MTVDREGDSREISYGAVLTVEPDRAFAFVSDPHNWPTFFDSVQSAEALTDWGQPGGQGRMVTSFLGRTVISDLVVTEWDPPRVFRYTARQRGRPDLDNRRTFEQLEAGTRLVGTTRIETRPGLNGLIDRLSLRVLHRIYHRAMDRLPDVIAGPGR